MVFESIPEEMILFATSFLFVFAIVFALLIYTKLFKESRAASGIIAAVIGFAAALYAPFALIIKQIIPFGAIVLVIIFFIVFIKTLFKHGEGKKDVVPAIIVLAVSLLLLGVFWNDISSHLGLTIADSQNLLYIVGIVIILGIFYAVYIVKSEESTKKVA